MKRAEAALAACIVMLFSLCGAVFACAGLLADDGIYPGVSVESAAVSGLTPEEAQSRFSGMEKLEGALVGFTVDGKPYTVSAQDVGARRNVGETVGEAWSLGRAGSAFERLSRIFALRAHPVNLSFQTAWDDGLLKGVANDAARLASLPPRNAALQFLPMSDPPFAYIHESMGRGVESSTLYSRIKSALEGSAPSSFQLISGPISPEITEEGLRADTQLIGSCTTALVPDAARNRNIRLAGNAVNGAVIWPGGEFSFNGRTGERTKEKGYADAAAIAGGQLVDETGGGVCQVATTVYDAALLAGLTVKERRPHSRPMYYVQAGMDAMVDFASAKDLRLKNDSATPVYLVFRMDEARQLVTAEFYGAPPKEAIRISAEDYRAVMPGRPEEIANPEKPAGWSRTLTEARQGCSVSIYRIYTLNGADTRRELVSRDSYPPQQGKMEIGTKPPSGEVK